MIWMALAVKTGTPPRLLKRKWSIREALQLFEYYKRYPFDDESNNWLPMAMMMSFYLNNHKAEDKPPITAQELIPFRPENRVEDDDEEIDFGAAFDEDFI